MSGYYLHSRKAFELYIKKPQILAVCEVILYSVRYKTCEQNGITVNSGQCLMTLQEISEICSLSVMQVRTAIKTMVSDGGITAENMGRKGILITLLPEFSCEAEIKKGGGRERQSAGYAKGTYKKTDSHTEASYDLIKAEQWARAHPPKLQKRR